MNLMMDDTVSFLPTALLTSNYLDGVGSTMVPEDPPSPSGRPAKDDYRHEPVSLFT